MDRKMIMKTVLVVFGTIYFGFIIQTSIFNRIALAGITPNILLVITVAFGYLKGRKAGVVIGFVCGILLDVFIGSYFGMNALIFIYIGYLNGLVRLFYFGDDVKFPMLLIAVSDMLYGCIVFATMLLMRERYDFSFYFEHVIVPEAIYTVIVGIVVYMAIYAVIRWADKQEKRATREIV
ncbi:MAG: rod shape-determining protein MreD [Lachnospiraceae bacterium]|nr:rod shape-determining protein MreD [Lachnospiraceae bacterium]